MSPQPSLMELPPPRPYLIAGEQVALSALVAEAHRVAREFFIGPDGPQFSILERARLREAAIESAELIESLWAEFNDGEISFREIPSFKQEVLYRFGFLAWGFDPLTLDRYTNILTVSEKPFLGWMDRRRRESHWP